MSKKSEDKLQRLVEDCMLFDSDDNLGSEININEWNIDDKLETCSLTCNDLKFIEAPMEIEEQIIVSTDQETEEIIENYYIVNPETGILEEISSESNIISPPLDTQRETEDPNTSKVVQENLIKDVKHLLSFVPESERYYYEDIIAGVNTLPDLGKTDNDEEV